MAPSSQSRRVLALVFYLAALSLSTINLVHANLLGDTFAKLSYDRISVRNKPLAIDAADTIAPGEKIHAGIIDHTGSVPKGGLLVTLPRWTARGKRYKGTLGAGFANKDL